MAKQPAEPKPEPLTFEAAITRLENLCEQLDSREIPLEELIANYQQGLELVRVCEERLKDAEKRIEIITRNAGGEPALAEFEPEPKTTPKPREDVSLF
jgi:exodeoxyribonuclease VII small subunit